LLSSGNEKSTHLNFIDLNWHKLPFLIKWANV
jgi:hypothetical protein